MVCNLGIKKSPVSLTGQKELKKCYTIIVRLNNLHNSIAY